MAFLLAMPMSNAVSFVVCTVGSGNTFPTIQMALYGCNGGTGAIKLLLSSSGNTTVNTRYDEILMFPKALTAVFILPQTANTGVTLAGAGHYVDPTSWLALKFFNISFDAQHSSLMLFEPGLYNTNLTCQYCTFVNFNGTRVLWGEPCEDSTVWILTDSVWSGVHGSAIHIDGAESIIFERNTCPRCSGVTDVDHGAVHLFGIHSASHGWFIWIGNAGWAHFDGQQLRCRYYLDAQAQTRCTQVDTDTAGRPVMQMQCYDELTTLDLDFCTQGSAIITDPFGLGVDVNVANTFLPYCRTYRECQCNSVLFTQALNGTTSTVTLGLGNVVYPDLTLACVPDSAITAVNGTYTCTEVFNAYTSGEINCATGFTSGVLAASGSVPANCSCPRNRTRNVADLRNPDEFPCRYSPDPGLLCEEETMFCCAEPYWSFDGARYYLESCGEQAHSDGTVAFSLYKDTGQLYVLANPAYNATHFALQAWAKLDGVLLQTPTAPLAYYDNSMTHTVTVAGMGTLSASAVNLPGTIVGDVLYLGAINFFGEHVSVGVHGVQINSTWDYYRIDTSARGMAISQYLPMDGSASDQCMLFELLVGTLDLFVNDPRFITAGSYASTLDLTYVPNYSDYSIVVHDTKDAAGQTNNTLFFLVSVNNTLCANLTVQVNTLTATLAAGTCAGLEQSTFTATRTLDMTGFVNTRQVTYTLAFSGGEVNNPLVHSWQYNDVSFSTDDFMRYATTMGVFSDHVRRSYPQSVFGVTATYDVDIVRIPHYFESVLLGTGCAAGLEAPSCIVMSECSELFGNGSAAGCTLLDCSAQYAALNVSNVMDMPTLAFLSTCAVLETDSTVALTYLATLGCIYRTDNFVFNETFVDSATAAQLQRVDAIVGGCLPMAFHQPPVNTPNTCASGLHVDCSCAEVTGNASLPQSASDAYWPDSVYTCLDGAATCVCNATVFGALYPPQKDTSMFYISHLPDTLSMVQIIDNRAQQLSYGLFLDQVSYELLERFSIVLPTFRDAKGTPRIAARQDNEDLTGVVHDVVQYPRWTAPPRHANDPLDLSCQVWCDDMCEQDLIDPTDYVCIVDKEVTPETPGYGTYIFENITSALEYSSRNFAGCRNPAPLFSAANKTIQVRFSEQFYDETIELTSDVQNVYVTSFDSALVSGSDHRTDGRVRNLQLQGMVFMHAEENKKALFNVVNRNLGRFTARNCGFIGNGVHSGGTLEGRAIGEVVFQFCMWDNWEVYAVRLLNVDTVVFENNALANTVGRGLYVEFNEWVRVENNVLFETRGGSDFKEAAIVTLRARTRDACQEYTVGGSTFLPATRRNNCTLIRNIQHVDFFDEDYRDQCFWVDRGNWNAWRMNRNKCIKAQYGITLSNLNQWQSFGSQTANDTRGGTLEWFSIYNPYVRPTLFRLTTSTKYVGWDYRLRGGVSQTPVGQKLSGLFALFSSLNKDTRNFNDLDKNLKPRVMASDYRFEIVQVWLADNGTALQCEVNNNYDDCSMRYDFGPPLAAWGFDRVYPVHGFHQFHNVSSAVSFCADARVLRGSDPIVFVTSWNASRIRVDNITVTRDLWILGDTSDPWTWCRLDNYNYAPVVVGHDHIVAARFFNMSYIEFWLDASEDDDQTEMWRTFNVPQKGMTWDHVVIDGRNIPPNGNTRIAYIECGEAVRASDGSKGGRRNTKRVASTSCLLEFYDVVVRNFYAFAENRVVDQSSGAVETVDSFPYADGFRIKCVNTVNSLSQVVIQNTSFVDVDREGLEIYDCLRIYLMDSTFANCSGRSSENRACLYIDGNEFNNTVNASVVFTRNVTVYQRKPLLFPTDGRPMNPAHVSAFLFNGYGNETKFCFFDNVAYGLEVGVRFVQMNRSILNSCLAPNETFFFGDRARELRAICRYGRNWNVTGRWHDLVWDGPGTQDRWRNNEWCDDNCCPLVDPTICYVDQVPELMVPENPWYGRFVFDSICDAIEHCQARDRFIAVIGQQNTFGWYPDDTTDEMGKSNNGNFVPFKRYDRTLDCVAGPRVLMRSVFNTTTNSTTFFNVTDYSPIVVSGSAGHEICASGHRIDTQQGVRIRLMGLNFTQCGNAPTWDQPASYSSANMVLEGVVFDGMQQTNALQPLNGVFDNRFVLRDSLVANYVGPYGATLGGRDCGNTLLTMRNNVFKNIPGAVLSLSATQSLDFSGNTVRESGGQLATTPLWVVYLSVCNASSPGVMRVNHNVIRAQQQTYVPPSGQHIAAFYFDGVYLATKTTRITNNVVTAVFDIGARFDNMPGASRAVLRSMALADRNIAVQGSWRDLVWGPPSIDPAIDADPVGMSDHYCDNGCAGNDYSLFGYLLGAVVALIVSAVAVYLLCCARKRASANNNTFYSQFLGIEVSTNTHQWRELVSGATLQRADPAFSQNQYVPLTGTVNPSIELWQQQTDAFNGYVPNAQGS